MSIITIADIEVRQDDQGRYSLNDLHRASGGERKHGPSLWMENQQTKELIATLALEEGDTGFPVSVVRGGLGQGSYVAKELVYAYAMWISPVFHLKVIRTFDAVATGKSEALTVPQSLPEALRLAAKAIEDRDRLALENKAKDEALAQAAPKVEAHDRIADAEGSVTIRETANTLRIPERKFVLWLQQNNWCYRRAGHKSLLGYADKVKAGYLYLKQTPIRDIHTGEERLSEQVRVTPLGLTVLARRLKVEVDSDAVPGVVVAAGQGGYAERRV